MPEVLPSAVDQNLAYEDFYETTLAQPLNAADTDVFTETLPISAVGFLVIDGDGTSPETIFYNEVGANFVRCPSATDGQGRGVFQTTPQDWDSGTKIGMYSIAAYFEAIVTGKAMRDGFLQAHHFSSSINPNQWIGIGQTLNYGANNGQRETIYTASGDLTSRLSEGMRLQLPRVTAIGAHWATFVAASSQYATKASPSGIGVAGPFTYEAQIYLNSYPGLAGIVGQFDGSSNGTLMFITATGQLAVQFGSSGNTTFYSNQTIPLKRKVHVAAAVTSVSGKTAVLYIDGISVPLNQTGSATTITQAGRLQIGAYNSTGFADMNIAEVRMWSGARTAQNILDNMNKQLSGSESGLLGYWPLDGNFNDLTSNANNLTSTGGAVATTLGNPFSATEYGIITKVSYATGTTTVTVFTGQNVGPQENLTNVSYSGLYVPYGFPSDKNHWRLAVPSGYGGSVSVAGASSGVYPATAIFNISAPTGRWSLGWQGYLELGVSVSTANLDFHGALYDVAAATTIGPAIRNNNGASSTFTDILGQVKAPIATPSMQQYTFSAGTTNGSGTMSYAGGFTANRPGQELYLECAYI